MSKSENVKAFEAALKDNKDLQEKYEAALKRIVENKEATGDGETLAKAAAEVGFSLTMADLERKQAENEELSDDDLEMVSGGADTRYETACWSNYHCQLNHKFDGTGTDIVCMLDYLCSYVYHDPDQWDDMFDDML